MFSKEQLLEALVLEMRVLRHLAGRLTPGALDWRPSPGQRTILELLRYVSTAGIDLTRAMLSGVWDPAAVTAMAPTTLRADQFDAAMARQEADIRAALAPLTAHDLETRRSTLPTGVTTNLGCALTTVVWRVLSGYRMQLFLYAKASGSTGLTTANCWFGVDAPASPAAP